MKTNSLKTFIIDDEIQAVRLLKDMAITLPFIDVAGTFTDPIQGLLEVRTAKPELLLLDIQMPRMNGFELLRGVRNAGLSPWVIFVTAYDQYAMEAIHNEAFDYLMKPVSPQELENSVTRLLSRRNAKSDKPVIDKLLSGLSIPKLRFSDRNGITFIDPSDIVYVEADGNYCTLQLRTRHQLVTRKIGEIEEMLLPHGFLRISRSYIINPVYLSRIDRKLHTCQLECGEGRFEIPVAEDRLKEV